VVKQTNPGGRHLVQQLLRELAAFAPLEIAEVRHPLVSRALDDIGITLKNLDCQQAIMVRRLLFRWNAQPFVIRVENCRHLVPRRIAIPFPNRAARGLRHKPRAWPDRGEKTDAAEQPRAVHRAGLVRNEPLGFKAPSAQTKIPPGIAALTRREGSYVTPLAETRNRGGYSFRDNSIGHQRPLLCLTSRRGGGWRSARLSLAKQRAGDETRT
jgi:hypothetical protein